MIAIHLTTSYDGSEHTGRAYKRFLKKSQDTGLMNHRVRFLPLHFNRGATGRYGGPYIVTKKRRGGGGLGKKFATMTGEEKENFWGSRTAKLRAKRYFEGLTPRQRREWQGMRRSEQRRILDKVIKTPLKRGRRGNDAGGKIPLVDTGRLKSASAVGPVSFHLPVARRRMTIQSQPWYLTVNQPGKIKKVAALQAVTPSENEAFIRVVDTTLEAQVRKSKVRWKKGS